MTAKPTLLLFGRTGKVGTALSEVLADRFEITGLNSRDLDVADFGAVDGVVAAVRPDVIVNTAAFQGIDANEKEPGRAFRINALFPHHLARLADAGGAVLVHFSTECVFSGEKRDFLEETDVPDPVNQYGFTKLAADCFIAATLERHYIFRLPVLFGPSAKRNQFVERMLDKARAGESLRVAADIVTSPTYTLDVASAVADALAGELDFGLHHIANQGQASLYDLMRTFLDELGIDAVLEPASFEDFPSVGKKNTFTPLTTTRRAGLRPWRDAVAACCRRMADPG